MDKRICPLSKVQFIEVDGRVIDPPNKAVAVEDLVLSEEFSFKK